MKTLTILFLLITTALSAQVDILTFNKTDANNLRGRYGNHSALDPIPLPDGTFMLPQRCLHDPKLTLDSVLIVGEDTSIVTYQIIDMLLDLTQDSNVIAPLPEFGEECVAGLLYTDTTPRDIDDETGSNVLKCVQTHNRTEHDPKTIPALFTFFRINSDTLIWIENEYVYVGWKRVYEGATYEVIQEHMTLVTWTPDVVPALWQLDVTTSEWEAGIAVTIGEQYTYEGSTYEVLQSHTTQTGWEPPNVPALWLLIE